MKNLKKHSKIFTQMMALKAVLDDMKDDCIKELKKMPDNKAIQNGVEYHLTSSTRRTYNSKQAKALAAKLKKQKEKDALDGKFKETATTTFDSYIPESTIESVLASSSKIYKNHFGL